MGTPPRGEFFLYPSTLLPAYLLGRRLLDSRLLDLLQRFAQLVAVCFAHELARVGEVLQLGGQHPEGRGGEEEKSQE